MREPENRLARCNVRYARLNDELIKDADVIIVDESPLNALLAEHTVTQGEVQQLAAHLEKTEDVAAPLVRALAKSVGAESRLWGAELIAKLDQVLHGTLREAIECARVSPAVTQPPKPGPRADPANLPKQFLGRMLATLVHDIDHPNTLLAYDEVWTWYEKRPFLKRALSMASPPAMIILDGSANQQISERRMRPGRSSSWSSRRQSHPVSRSSNARAQHRLAGL